MRPVANFGVVVVSRAPGSRVEPRIVAAGDENRLTGYAALPVNHNPYVDEFGDPSPVAGAVRPRAGLYHVVFDSAGAKRRGHLPLPLLDRRRDPPERTPLRAARFAPASPWWPASPTRARASTRPRSRRRSAAARPPPGFGGANVQIATNGLAPGRHRLRLQLSDYQESRNNENVTRILPNTRVVSGVGHRPTRLDRVARHSRVAGRPPRDYRVSSRRWKVNIGTSTATARVVRSRTPATAATRLRPRSRRRRCFARERLLDDLAEALEPAPDHGRRRGRIRQVDAPLRLGRARSTAPGTRPPRTTHRSQASRGVSPTRPRLRVPALPVGRGRAGDGHGRPRRRAGRDRRGRAGSRRRSARRCKAALRRDLVLVVDDVQAVAGSAGAVQVIESLCRQAPPRLHLVARLARRAAVPDRAPARPGAGAGARRAPSWRSTPTRRRRSLASLAGAVDAETADRASATRPAAGPLRCGSRSRRFAACRPPSGRRRSTASGGPGGPLLAYLAAEVFAHEPPEVEALVRTVAPLDALHRRSSASRSGSRTPRRRSTRSRGEGSSSSFRATRSAGTRSAPRSASSRSPAGGPSAAEMRRVRTARGTLVRGARRARGGASRADRGR